MKSSDSPIQEFKPTVLMERGKNVRVAVAYKWAASPQEAEISSDGIVDWSRAKAGFGDYDAVAAELARRLSDQTGGELIGISVGGSAIASSLARKGALSRGLDRLSLVADLPESQQGPAGTASALAKLVAEIGDIDVLVAGDASADMAASVVPAMTAARLGWPVITDVSSITAEDGRLRLVRSVVGGTETLSVACPVVVVAAADAVKARVPGMKDILAAGKKPTEQVAHASLGAAPAPEPARLTRGPSTGPDRGRHLVGGSDAGEAGDELVSALKGAGIL